MHNPENRVLPLSMLLPGHAPWARLRRLFLLLVLASFCWVARAEVTALDVASEPPQGGPISLAPYFAVLEDVSQTLSLADVREPERSQQFVQDVRRQADLSFGRTKSAIWLRLTLKNSGDVPVERLLELAYAGYLNVQFHVPTDNGQSTAVTTGRVLPFESRAYPHRQYVFPVRVPPHTELTAYLRIQSIVVPVPANLWSPASFQRHERRDYMTWAVYVGVAVAMFLFNLVLYAVLRDRMYLWYLITLTLTVLTFTEQSGLAKEFLWPDAPSWSLMAVNVFPMLALAALMTFMRHMLNMPVSMPRIDRFQQFFRILLILSVPALAWDTATVTSWAASLILVGFCVTLASGLYGVVLRLNSAYFFVAAYSVVLVSGSLYTMRNLGLLSNSPWMAKILPISSALEMILLALALADRFNQIRLENIKVHREALSVRDEMVAVLQESGRQLEVRVSERTSELEAMVLQLKAARARLIGSERRASLGERAALKALAAQQQFIAMVSHEFRSPLAVIDNAAQLLTKRLDGSTENKVTPLVTKIRRGTFRLTQFLDACMTQDRLQSAGLLIKPQSIDPQALVAAARETVQLLSEHHQLEASVQTGLPDLRGDPELLHILLTNLLSNAIKYSPAGSDIQLRFSQAAGGHAIEVIDQGCGIAADEISHVFERYRRGRETHGQPGSGLGLALCLQIVELHGGHMALNSEPGVGTQVVIEFPATTDIATSARQANPAGMANGPAAADPG